MLAQAVARIKLVAGGRDCRGHRAAVLSIWRAESERLRVREFKAGPVWSLGAEAYISNPDYFIRCGSLYERPAVTRRPTPRIRRPWL